MAARVLMGQPSNTIGLIVPNLADTFFSEIAHIVQVAARDLPHLEKLIDSLAPYVATQTSLVLASTITWNSLPETAPDEL